MSGRFEVTIAWGDCDEAGIVFYPNYFYWMDSAFNALLRDRGLSQRVLKERFGAMTPIVETSAKFLAPASYDDVLQVDSAIEHWGEKSFRVAYRATRAQTPIFEGFEARVWAVPREGGGIRTVPLPPAFREALA